MTFFFFPVLRVLRIKRDVSVARTMSFLYLCNHINDGNEFA